MFGVEAGGVGMVYFCNIFPSFLVKGTSAFWFHLVSYEQRIRLCALGMMLCVTIVGLSHQRSWQLLGVAIGAFASALGEASFLAYSSTKKGQEQTCLTAWSSGTGMAGVFGYLWVFVFTKWAGTSFAFCSLAANSLAVAWLANFYFLIDPSAYSKVETNSDDGDRSQVREAEREEDDHDQFLQDGEHLMIGQANNDLDSSPYSAQEPRYVELTSSPDGNLSLRDRAMIVIRLRAFTLPLFAVYVAEYTLQSGCWAAIGFPVDDKSSRDTFYLYSNWMYQIGVFFSRSSGTFVNVSALQLWIMPVIQVGMLLFFIWNGVSHFWWNNGLLILAFIVGLLGGAVYVHGMIWISKSTRPKHRETALAGASVADTFGITLANILGIIVQGCLYGANGITDDGKPPTFKCGYTYD